MSHKQPQRRPEFQINRRNPTRRGGQVRVASRF